MRILAISDLHLSLSGAKPMDVFGAHWRAHHERIRASWLQTVTEADIVLLAGDLSWALRLPEAEADLAWVASLPGRKVLVKGNHDYWWSGLSKVRKAAGPGFHFLQNNAVILDGIGIAGARLWDYPFVRWPLSGVSDPDAASPPPGAGAGVGTGAGSGTAAGENTPPASTVDASQSPTAPADADAIRARERQRLELSLQALDQAAPSVRLALTHFPPVSAEPESNPLTRLLARYGVSLCVYGHVHAGVVDAPGADCVVDGCRYILTSCDALDFRLREVYTQA